MKLYTIGYERRGIEDFIDILKKNDIEILVDIRAVPHSRSKDFAKSNLERHLSENGIGYLLCKELGSPKELRNKVRSDGNYGYFFGEYDRFLEGRIDLVTSLSEFIKYKNTCLLCYEADAGRCHRSSVARELGRLERNLEIANL